MQSILEDRRAHAPSTKSVPLGTVGWRKFLFGEESVQRSSLTLHSWLSSRGETFI